MILPYAQIQAIRTLKKSHYAFSLMYFKMMLFGAIPGVIISKCSQIVYMPPLAMGGIGMALTFSYMVLRSKIAKIPSET